MKVGFCVVNYSELPVEKAVDIAVEHGYEAVELPSYQDNGQVDADALLQQSGAGAKSLAKSIRDRALDISAISNHADSVLVMGPHGKDCNAVCQGTPEEQIAFGTNSLLRSAQLANAMEVPVVVAFTGVGNFGRFNDWPYPDGWKDELNDFAHRYAPILDKFKEYGVKLAFEPHPNNIMYDIYSCQQCIAAVDNHPNIGINFDPANLMLTGISVEAFVDELKDRIFHVHAKDCEIVEHNLHRGGYWMYQGDWGAVNRSTRFRIPGWGSVNWKNVISELALIGYFGVFSYEHEDVLMSRADGTKKTIEFLKPLMIDAPYEGRTDKLFTR